VLRKGYSLEVKMRTGWFS